MAVKNVTVKEAHQKQREGHTYVDVRSVQEFEQGHPAGAINVPWMHRDERTGQMTPNPDFLDVMRANFPPDANLLIGCQAGARSAQAAELLASSGYRNISNVVGGYGGSRDAATGGVRGDGWVSAGLPIETGQPEGASYEAARKKASQRK